MKALQQLLPNLISEPFDVRLMNLLRHKTNSCHAVNVKGFWLKLGLDEQSRNLTVAEMDMSFFKPIEGAQIALEITPGHEDYLSDEQNDTNAIIRFYHNKNNMKKSFECIEDTIVNYLNIKILDEDYQVKRIQTKKFKEMIAEIGMIHERELENKTFTVIEKIFEGYPADVITKAKKEFLQFNRESQDYATNIKKIDAAKEAYMKN